MRLLTVQIGVSQLTKEEQSVSDESGNESGKTPRLKFEYITEVTPKITNFQAEKQKPGYLSVISQSDSDDHYFFVYTGVGKHSVVYKQPLISVMAPKVDIVHKIPVKESFFSEMDELKKKRKEESTVDREVDQIMRKIDEDCAKEQDELDQQLKANIQDAFNEIDGINQQSDQETLVMGYGANRLAKPDKEKEKKDKKTVKKEDSEEPTTAQQLLGEKYSKHMKQYQPKANQEKPKEAKQKVKVKPEVEASPTKEASNQVVSQPRKA